MFENQDPVVLDLLSRHLGLDDQRREALSAGSSRTGTSVAAHAVAEGIISAEALLDAVADYLGLPAAEPVPSSVADGLQEHLDANTAWKYGVVPLEKTDRGLRLLAVDPFNGALTDELAFVLSQPVEIAVGDPAEIRALISKTYGLDGVQRSNPPPPGYVESQNPSPGAIEGADDQPATGDEEDSVIRFVDIVLRRAIRKQASDIHFEPFKGSFRIRYRIDGVLYEMDASPHRLAGEVVSRIKVLAELDTSENRLPQDGRILTEVAGRVVDLRVSTLPTRFGESVVIRVLDKEVMHLELDHLHMPEDVLEIVRRTVRRPNGIFVVTGPTGSGKTTTLYSALREVNRVERKILTAEDPIEYRIDGVMQVGVNHRAGLDFAGALRSFLRQDPDMILVGEIRDLETAQIAVQASLTGHVVLSTLHTNDAPGAVIRLMDMGLEPELISSALEAVLAQRLVRRIDPDNRVSYHPDGEVAQRLGLDPRALEGRRLYYGAAVPGNNHTGYRGRIGLFELFQVTDELRVLIQRRSPVSQLRSTASKNGMRRLREDGLRALFSGETTVEEILKYT